VQQRSRREALPFVRTASSPVLQCLAGWTVKSRLLSIATRAAADVYSADGPGSLGWDAFDSDRFQFLEQIGKGGWGTVHRALDHDTGLEVAIKTQSKWPVAKPGLRVPSQQAVLNRLKDEGQLLRHMQCSKRVVKLLHKMEDKDNSYLVTELLQGGDLEKILSSKRRLSEEYACLLTREVLLFLRDCHTNGICFTDVKPANFMLCKDADDGELTLKAIDFGCAQVLRPGDRLVKRAGTPAYFAPEVFLRNYGLEADTWSAGIMLYRFITGQLPWFDLQPDTRIAPNKIQAAVLSGPMVWGPTWNYKSEACLDLAKAMLHRDPNRRIAIEDAVNHKWFMYYCGSEDHDVCHVDEGSLEELVNNVVPASFSPKQMAL